MTIKIEGHRGSKATHIENTLPAFLEAIEARADEIECDLRLTKDGYVVIYHDDLLKGRPISEWNLSEMQNIDFGLLADPTFPNRPLCATVKIPTLEEFFSLLQKKNDITANLEIKKVQNPSVLVGKILALVKKFGLEKRVYYSSFDIETLYEVKKALPSATLSYIVDPKGPLSLPNIKVESIAVQYKRITKKLIENLHSQGVKVAAWTANEPSEWQTLFDIGVDAIITDYPRKCVAYFSKKERV